MVWEVISLRKNLRRRQVAENENELALRPEYQSTMERLEKLRRTTDAGTEYWMAREIGEVLGYPVWSKFEPVIERAMETLRKTNREVSHHFAQTGKMMEVGNGAMREGADYFVTRGACYLIAMNGDPSKPEIAAAQAYFAAATREMELHQQAERDQKRIELRDKATESFKRVSGKAKDAGVSSKMQGVFHDQRYRGLYGMSARDVAALKGLDSGENLLDRAGPLELSMHDFQMNLAASVLEKESVRGERKAIDTNLRVAQGVRRTVVREGGELPENLPSEPPIKEVRKRINERTKRAQIEKKPK